MEYFDSHAHYNDKRYNEDRDALINNMYKAGVTMIVNAGNDLETSKESIKLAEKHKHFYATCGIHPSDIKGIDLEKELKEIEDLCKHEKVVAVGEIGLDYYWDKDNKEVQKSAFIKQIELANKLNLPIVIHSRDAYQDTIDVLKNIVNSKNGGIFHCCQLNQELIKEALNLGFNVSFGGPITFKNSKNAEAIINMIPLERLQIETDAPYLSPEPLRGTRNDSSNLKYVVEKIAEFKNIPAEVVAKTTYENAKKLFRIK